PSTHCHPEPAEGSLGPSARKTHRVFSEDGPEGPRNPSARRTHRVFSEDGPEGPRSAKQPSVGRGALWPRSTADAVEDSSTGSE
ncbi:MAG: hypothetical protein LBL86_04185, partial [Coriobacteriales bacterium]|nr:hypothetical protein [Coriobacteriales bacterium]